MIPLLQRHPLWILALIPIMPQIVGSAFNICHHLSIIIPALPTEALHARFSQTTLIFNLIVYPLGASFWFSLLLSLRPAIRALEAHTQPS